MTEKEILKALVKHSPFGVPVIQRVTGYGYQRALDFASELEAKGLLQPTEQPSYWRVSLSS